MASRFESLLSKVGQWGRKAAEGNEYVQWPQNMLPYLEKRFHLLPKDMAALHCVRHRGILERSPVNFVRLYNRAMAHEQDIIVKSYYDLDEYPELVLFEGYIFKGGTVHLKKKESTVAG